jgi:hypothetical protein
MPLRPFWLGFEQFAEVLNVELRNNRPLAHGTSSTE